MKEKLEKLLGRNYRHSEPLKNHTSFRTGGPALHYCEPSDAVELEECIALLEENGVVHYVVGAMTNVLVPDKGIEGAVVSTRRIKTVTVSGGTVEASCGCSMAALAEAAAKNSLTGLEFAGGIPGTVGGGIVMNAGAYGGEMRDSLVRVKALYGDQIRDLLPGQLAMGYRTSCFSGGEGVVLGAAFELEKGSKNEIKEKMKDLSARRRLSQPLEYPSAGSVFKRPEGAYAAALIDECGLKGTRCGGAMVSDKHSGFIINFDNATTDDILELIRFIQYTVYERRGVRLEPEIRMFGVF